MSAESRRRASPARLIAALVLAPALCLPLAACDRQQTRLDTFYVDAAHPEADDGNEGSETKPWKTIQAAAERLEAGQTAFVRAGRYQGLVRIAQSGRPDAPIRLKAFPGDEGRVILDGRQEDSRILIAGRRHVRIEGFRLEHMPGVAIDVRGPGGDIHILNNTVYDSFSSAIGVWGTPWQQDPAKDGYRGLVDIVIRGNTIQRAVDGGWNEQITIANGVDGVEISGNQIFEGGDSTNGGEGIDLKAGVRNARIFGNTIREIRRMGIYIDASGVGGYYSVPPLMENIEIFDNRILNQSGTGITIGTEGSGSVRGVRVYNNVVANAGIQGILVYLHPQAGEWGGAPGTLSDVQIFNNTVSGSARYGIAVRFEGARDVRIENNVSTGNGYGDVAILTPGEGVAAAHNVTDDPLFRDADALDFTLKPGSPAIDAATGALVAPRDIDGHPRPQGAGPDVGAFEFRAPEG